MSPFIKITQPIDWTHLTAKHIIPDMEQVLLKGQAALDAIGTIPAGEETLQNTFFALEEAAEIVSRPWGLIEHLNSVNDHPELRQAHRSILGKVTSFFSAIPLNQTLYKKLQACAVASDERALSPVEKRFIKETLKDFEDEGANLGAKDRTRLMAIEAKLAEQTQRFADHVLDSTNAYEKIIDNVEDLAGLPETLIEAARLDALSKGYGSEAAPRWRLTLQAPSFIPAMRFLHSDDLRKELFIAYTKVGHSNECENEPLIREILALRKEKAQLLGHSHFPNWVLSRRMAKNLDGALGFVENLQEKTVPFFKAETDELAAYKAKVTGSAVAPLNQWETAYWTEKLRKDRFDFDEEELRPYFPMESVMDGLFSLSEKLFGVRVENISAEGKATWHTTVETYALYDTKTEKHLGTFYTDWYPRETKRSGAWMNGLITGNKKTNEPHLGFIAGNLMPPVGDKPALLSHSDVETIFHEFGHLLHHLLSEVPIRSLAGTNVAWDFVELPSQIMENWCWERESLDLFARHYKTGDPIPEDLFRKMQNARTFGAARMQMRQLAFCKMDLALHRDFDLNGDGDLDAFIDKALEGYLPPFNIQFPSHIRSFGHLFSDSTGYAAGYYSYKWAEVLDADAFTRFQAEGILNPETGLAFRKTILAQGNAKEPDALFREFMGRDPALTPLMERLGLSKTDH